MANIRLEGVSKRFGNGSPVVNNVTIDVNDKEFVVLVGPSGCGKSTTLRMIAGLEEISEGKIYIGTTMVNDVPPKDRDIAMVFQNYALYPHMTVYENLSFGLRMRKHPDNEIKNRVTEVADVLDIGGLLERKPKALSGGQRQRVALGRAIVRRPKLFLFDEPLSNLDANLRVHMRAEISRLQKQLETTMVYVTHDQVEAMSMGDRIVVMNNGIVQQADSPLMIYRKPVNRFVAGFVGSPAMNFLEGELTGAGGRVLVFKEANVSFNIEPQTASGLSPYNAKPVTLGIRPEHISVRPLGGAFQKVAAVIEAAEPVGNEAFLFFTIPPSRQKFVCRIPADLHPEAGTRLDVWFDTSKFHFFDPRTGVAV